MKEYKYKINGLKFTVAVGDTVDGEVTVEVNGTPYKVELEKTKSSKPAKPALSQSGKTESAMAAVAASAPTQQVKPVVTAGPASAVKSPLPGTIMSFNVKEGDTVKAGDTVCVLEAMKMENDIHCTNGGTVKKILVSAGDAILEGTDIMIIE